MAQEYVPNCNNVMNDILDLYRDLHADNFALCEEYTPGIQTLSFALSFCQRVALRAVLEGLLPPFDDAWHCWFH